MLLLQLVVLKDLLVLILTSFSLEIIIEICYSKILLRLWREEIKYWLRCPISLYWKIDFVRVVVLIWKMLVEVLKEHQITIRSSVGMFEDEIEKMVKEAELHAQKDQEMNAFIEIKNSVDSSIYSMEKSLDDYRYKISAEIASEIESVVADLCNELEGDDAEKIKTNLDVANKEVSKIGQHMSGGSSGPSSRGSQVGDQAPEANYEEVKK